MEFRTILPPYKSPAGISHRDKTLCIGSCFAEEMGGRLAALKFPVFINPFGIVFNPASIARSLEMLLADNDFPETALFFNQGLWHSFDHHGHFSHPDKAAALANIEQKLREARQFLSSANRLIVTLGTANVFIFREKEAIVANCHKVPANAFDRRRLGIAEVVEALSGVFEKLKNRFPALEIILTVSPVRHLRDGLTENQRSKATLVLATEALCHRHTFVHYFPACELLLDDLRDYRFYDADLVHPNALALDYIWEYFENAFFDESTKSLCHRISQVTTAAAHRPFFPQSAEHQAFVQQQAAVIAGLEQEFPSLDFSNEKAVFKLSPAEK